MNIRQFGVVCCVFVSGIALSGCLGNAHLVPQTSHGQTANASDDSNTLISEKTHIVKLVTLKSDSVRSNRAHFDISVQNRLDDSFYFSSGNVAVEIEPQDDSSTWTPLKVFTYTELDAEVKERYRWAQFAAAVGGLGRVIQASRGGSYAGYDYSSNRNTAMSEAQLHNNLESSYLDSSHQNDLAKLKTYMSGQYVNPEQWYGGIVVVDAPDPEDAPTPLRVRVQAGDDVHTFTYLLQKPAK